jgi:glycosyltransferase involved in cell wall biosynthesis
MDGSRQLKIAHVDTGQEFRGGQRQLLRLARGLRQGGHRQIIVCPDGSRLEARALAEGFTVFALPDHDPAHAHGIIQFRQQLLADPLHILHAHDGRGQTIAWLASLGMGMPRLASRRVTFLPETPFIHRVKYDYTCDALIAVSGFIRQLLVDSGVPPGKIEVIPDGIEIPPVLPDAECRSRVRAAWGYGEHEFVVGHLGAFTPEKGQDLAVEALNLLASTLPQARLVLMGEGPLRERLPSNPSFQKVESQVLLLRDVEDLSNFFAGLDLFIMPSRAEGLGSAALLAMAHGLAVIASRVGGLPEIVEEHQTGWLIPPGSASALAEAIIAAASDRAGLAQLGANARETARRFSADIMVDRTEALYFRLVEWESRSAAR